MLQCIVLISGVHSTPSGFWCPVVVFALVLACLPVVRVRMLCPIWDTDLAFASPQREKVHNDLHMGSISGLVRKLLVECLVCTDRA